MYATRMSLHFKSFSIFTECNTEPVSIREDEAFLNEAQLNLEAFESSVLGVTDTVTEFCGTIDSELFSDTIATASNFGCALFGLLLNVRDALKCRTWMPLYYNTGECFVDMKLYSLMQLNLLTILASFFYVLEL